MIRGWEKLSMHTGLCRPLLVRLVRIHDFPKPIEEKIGYRKTFLWDTNAVDEWQKKNEKYGRVKSTLRFTSVVSAVNSQLAAT